MADQIRFDDGDAYEKMMGAWSGLVGEKFIDWAKLPPGMKCIDVGCGNGAFTELLVDRCIPVELLGVDPSPGQLAFARTRPGARMARFEQGDAMALPIPDRSYDAAIMALVIFFVPEPAKGVAEMVRVVRPGGIVAAYAWDILGGGFPMEPIFAEIRALGHKTISPPRADASTLPALRALWTAAGLTDVETCRIDVERTFTDFEQFWTYSTLAGSVRPTVEALSPGDREKVRERVRAQLRIDSAGRVTHVAWANAVKGRAPK